MDDQNLLVTQIAQNHLKDIYIYIYIYIVLVEISISIEGKHLPIQVIHLHNKSYA